ncbi:MAG: hypothetical protein LBD23_04025 [Oscillospiraceae bacterium]|jgi:hypothetical protein|nr:hypothetical protein [Oscillospiraceae bacterium]
MKKRFLAIILCVGILMMAVGSPIAQARWTHLRSINLNMSHRNNTITSSTSISGLSGTTRITASFILEVLVNGQYQHVDSWSASSNSILLSNTRETSNCSARTYRLRVTATVTRNGTNETVSDSIVRSF